MLKMNLKRDFAFGIRKAYVLKGLNCALIGTYTTTNEFPFCMQRSGRF